MLNITIDNGIKGPDWAIVLTIIFMVLKLTDSIDWSWWWVLSPLWIGFLLDFLIVVLIEVLKNKRY